MTPMLSRSRVLFVAATGGDGGGGAVAGGGVTCLDRQTRA